MESSEAIVKCLLQSIYVDDIVSGAASEDEAFELYAQAKAMFGRRGFNLWKFLSNSMKLQQRIDCAESKQLKNSTAPLGSLDKMYAQATLGTQPVKDPGECKILGVTWDPTSDCLIFDVSEIARLTADLQPTKRNLISLTGRFYDPLGYLAPITIRFKILFQKLRQNKLEWDHILPGELVREWRELIDDL